MEIDKIYFDMDGVLADFDRGIYEICGMVPMPQTANNDAEREDAMWRRVKEAGHFYDMLEVMPGAKEMFDIIYEKHGDKCEILTGIPNPRREILSAGEDKINWMRRLLSKDIKMNIVYRREKVGFCKGKGSILIDDFDKNINEWNAAGGTGILHTGPAETLECLKKMGII